MVPLMENGKRRARLGEKMAFLFHLLCLRFKWVVLRVIKAIVKENYVLLGISNIELFIWDIMTFERNWNIQWNIIKTSHKMLPLFIFFPLNDWLASENFFWNYTVNICSLCFLTSLPILKIGVISNEHFSVIISEIWMSGIIIRFKVTALS